MEKVAARADDYTAEQFEVLEGLEGVRRRPAMYIGSTDDRGLQHCVWEILDNAIDEALAGFCRHIVVTLHQDDSVEVRDDGRGIPVDVEKRTKLPGVRVVFERLHGGAKFGGGAYEVSGGLHGVGAAVVNALSSRLDVVVTRQAKRWGMSWRRGTPGVFGPDGSFTPDSSLKELGRAPAAEHGTTVRYWADEDVFGTHTHVDFDLLVERSRQSVYLIEGLEVTCVDERGEEPRVVELRAEGGIAGLVGELASDEPLCDPVVVKGEGSFVETLPGRDGEGPRQVTRHVDVEIAFRWGIGYGTTLRSFVNVIETRGGTHVSGFERAVTRALSDAMAGTRLLKADESITKDDVEEGMTAVVVVRLPEPQFEGQTKDALATPEVTNIVASAVTTQMAVFLGGSRTKAQARRVLEKVSRAAKGRLAARMQRDVMRRKNALESSTLPAKLADCRSEDVTRNELLIVEGDSAMGCFSRDTQVCCVGGRDYTFGELVADWRRGVTHLGYASDAYGRAVVVPLLEPRCTKVDAEVIEVTLHNGAHLVCTPGHLFRLRDGSYRRADSLGFGTALMGIRRPRSPHAERLAADPGGVGAPGRAGTIERRGQKSHLGWPEAHHLVEEEFPVVVTSDGCWVVAVQARSERADVYDLTVEGYHNFALAAGVFVHNSAKQARDSDFQALLPIRGKILNTMRATERQVLDNAECAAIITAMGAGSGKGFNIDNARYGKFITLSVDSAETVLIERGGRFEIVGIGDLIDEYCEAGIDVPDARTATFDQLARSSSVAPIKKVIRHEHAGMLRRISTVLGRSVAVTEGHSVFTYDSGEVSLRTADTLVAGDVVVAPRTLPTATAPVRALDVVDVLLGAGEIDGIGVRDGAGFRWLRQVPDPANVNPDAVLVHAEPGFGGISRTLEVTEELCELWGWVAAVGRSRGPQVVFDVVERAGAQLERLVGLVEQCFGVRVEVARLPGGDGYRAWCWAPIHARLLVALGIGGDPGTRRLPQVLLNTDRAPHFLHGLFDSRAELPEIVVSSRELANGIGYLCGQLGRLAAITEERHSATTVYRLEVSGEPGAGDLPLGVVEISPTLVGLPITTIVDEPIDSVVYDLSVADDESFVCGFGGGVMCHNTDADVDGNHIRTLLVTLAWRYMRPLLEAGRVYAAVPPLFRITLKHTGEHIYTYTDEEHSTLLAQLESAGKEIRAIQRYKGLGEMDADQLAETTMQPGQRKLRRLTVTDALEAEACFAKLMGDEVEPRRNFIVERGGLLDPSRLDI